MSDNDIPSVIETASEDREGAAIRAEFWLDADVTFLNHGSYGAVPRRVSAAAEIWRQRMERQPVLFFQETLAPGLRDAAGVLAPFLGVQADDLVFVENATSGANAVLRSLRLAPGDTIVGTDHGYGAVRNTARHVAAMAGAALVEAKLPFPGTDPADVVRAIDAAIDGRTRLVVVDHVTSPTALVLPVEDIARLCRRRGVPLLVDGAHAPGMLDLDIAAVGADWYVGNPHKWLFAARGCAALWASPSARGDLHPPVVSHGYGAGYLAEFDWTGTRDCSPYLAVDAALAFYRSLGPARLRARNKALAAEGARIVAGAWQTEVLTPPAMAGSMALVALPFAVEPTREAARALRTQIWHEHRIEVPVMAFGGSCHIRISAQIYNEPADYHRLAEIFRR
ncbi:isopenicillin-N epimerase [Stella humosa]|uniref:Isopenicillin-N epimerase n=1 Tax=Stella humosa TaxID=94 RepID=A0A3N1KQF5_9PROT|nr:aminotransferase class V-fold PLP-dependent enzyme [Stella humosa]ROP84033.1 isopenicillin-N epimerase [Stella humosa]BBK33544.1 isopenicillin-N epimerase [Stella humosa]